MKWNKVLATEELAEGDKRTLQLAGETILLVHHKGEIFAVNNTCRHMGGSLVDGKITEEGTVVCPRHHSVFDLRTGEVIEWAPWPPVVGAVLGRCSANAAAYLPDEDRRGQHLGGHRRGGLE